MQSTPKEKYLQIDEKTILVNSPAKINLSLLVAGKRPDGYHELETIMAKVSLYDQLIFKKLDTQTNQCSLQCSGKYKLETDKNNLVSRAYHAFIDTLPPGSKPCPVAVELKKNIPIGAGLGGGSSNAAMTIWALNQLFQTNLQNNQLIDIAAAVGSDTAFFLGPKIAICTGRGEKIKKISNFSHFAALLIMPNISVSTKRVYDNYKHDQNRYNSLRKKILHLLTKNNIDLIDQICANMLAESCFQLNKNLASLKSRIEALGIDSPCLTGSGSAMFVLANEERDLKRYQSIIEKNIGCESVIVYCNRW
jgi:4-diphosphocytidyl-2-C-methyl-D-erythritol kinase